MKVSVCVLAHNEEKNILRTLKSLMAAIPPDFPVIIYANGCTDQTIPICKEYLASYPQMTLKVIERASKVNAWNQAFLDNSSSDYIIFLDGDIEVKSDSCRKLMAEFERNPQLIISTGRQLPSWMGSSDYEMTWQQRLVGFLQLPLKQEFLGGALYAFNRSRLDSKLLSQGFQMIPEEIVCEDGFLEFILDPHEMIVSEALVFYTPGNISDYIRYLARIRWQNEQLKHILGAKLFQQTPSHSSPLQKLIRKWNATRKERTYFALALFAVAGRLFFKFLFGKRITRAYRELGSVMDKGSTVLTQQTRSKSTK
jgi:glycosyltransferase involved in cell wall biosynthesis